MPQRIVAVDSNTGDKYFLSSSSLLPNNKNGNGTASQSHNIKTYLAVIGGKLLFPKHPMADILSDH
jgi:hypothetical protein